MLTVRDLQDLFRVGRTTAYDYTRSAGFPAPVALAGGSTLRWWRDEVLVWLQAHRTTARKSKPPRAATRVATSPLDAPLPSPVPVAKRGRKAAA